MGKKKKKRKKKRLTAPGIFEKKQIVPRFRAPSKKKITMAKSIKLNVKSARYTKLSESAVIKHTEPEQFTYVSPPGSSGGVRKIGLTL